MGWRRSVPAGATTAGRRRQAPARLTPVPAGNTRRRPRRSAPSARGWSAAARRTPGRGGPGGGPGGGGAARPAGGATAGTCRADRRSRPGPASARSSSRRRGPRRRHAAGRSPAEAEAMRLPPASGRRARLRRLRIGSSDPMGHAAGDRGSGRDPVGRGEATCWWHRSAQGNLNAERSSLSRRPDLCYVLSSQLMKAIGTPVAWPACRHTNPGINIWCERCRRPLDWNPATRVTRGRVDLPRRRRAFTLPRLTMPAVSGPRVRLPALTVPRPRMPHVPRIALVVAAILAVLLIVPVAYLLLPAGRAAVVQQPAASRLPSTNGTPAVDTPQAAAIPGVEAKTHLRYHAGTCDASTPCLTVVGETMGKDAAAVVFSTASSAARGCVGSV